VGGGGGGGGGVLTNVLYEERRVSAPRLESLPFNILIFAKIAPLSYVSRISHNNRIYHDLHSFPGVSVLLGQLLKVSKLLCDSHCYFCQNLAPFHILSFSRHLLHFAADFVTLSYTKIACDQAEF